MIFRSVQNTTSGSAYVGAAAYQGAPIIGDAGGYWGTYIRSQNSGSVSSDLRAQSYIWDDIAGDIVAPSVTADAEIDHDVNYLLRFSFSPAGGSLIHSRDGAADSVTAKPGNTTNLNSEIRLSRLAGGLPLFQGYIGEILIYDQALSVAERTKVLTYLDNKWNTGYS